MNRGLRLLTMAVFAMAVVSCDRAGQIAGPVDVEDWSFPPDSTAFEIRPWTRNATVAPNEEFDVSVLVYNLPPVAAARVALRYEADRVEVLKVVSGPFFPNSLLQVTRITEEANRISFSGTHTIAGGLSEGSGVLFKVKCRSLRAGRARFRFEGHPEFLTADGREIANRDALIERELEVRIE